MLSSSLTVMGYQALPVSYYTWRWGNTSWMSERLIQCTDAHRALRFLSTARNRVVKSLRDILLGDYGNRDCVVCATLLIYWFCSVLNAMIWIFLYLLSNILWKKPSDKEKKTSIFVITICILWFHFCFLSPIYTVKNLLLELCYVHYYGQLAIGPEF